MSENKSRSGEVSGLTAVTQLQPGFCELGHTCYGAEWPEQEALGPGWPGGEGWRRSSAGGHSLSPLHSMGEPGEEKGLTTKGPLFTQEKQSNYTTAAVTNHKSP